MKWTDAINWFKAHPEYEIWEPFGMKVYVLKYKDEVIKVAKSEYEVSSDYRWESKPVRDHLTIKYGTLTEEGSIEAPKVEEKEENV